MTQVYGKEFPQFPKSQKSPVTSTREEELMKKKFIADRKPKPIKILWPIKDKSE